MTKTSNNSLAKKIFALIILLSISGCANGAADSDSEDLSQSGENGEPVTEITVSCYIDNNAFLGVAARVFEVRHPDIKINIAHFAPPIIIQRSETVIRGEEVYDPQAEADYIQRLNTELMAGKGPDIIQIDIIPWYRYAENGYLEDLQAYMDSDADFNEADYRMNIINAVKFNNGQYAFPLAFSYQFFAYDTTLFTDAERKALSAKDTFTFGELIGIAEGTFDGVHNMFGFSGGYLDWSIFNPLLTENYTSFVDIENKKAYFDDGRFEQLLLSVTEYVEKGYIKSAAEVKGLDWGGYGGDIERPFMDERFYYKHKRWTGLFMLFDTELEMAYHSRSHRSTDGFCDDDAIAGMAAAHNGGVLFDTPYMYALNSNSKNKAAAWEFIKFLASEEVQCYSGIYAIPVNKNALREKMRRWFGVKSNLTDEQQQIFDEYLICADKYADTVNTYVIRDVRIDQFIEAEATAYFAGEKSAKDAAAALQNKAKLYFSE